MSKHTVSSDAMSPSNSLQHAAGLAGHDLEAAVDRAMLAPSLYNSQPWQFVMHPDRLEVRAVRSGPPLGGYGAGVQPRGCNFLIP
jgi:nitroreductase